jgi:hypothetical protein
MGELLKTRVFIGETAGSPVFPAFSHWENGFRA